jgi:transcriptional regulator with XRE-family HTH domain
MHSVSQTEFARRIGATRAAISRYARGQAEALKGLDRIAVRLIRRHGQKAHRTSGADEVEARLEAPDKAAVMEKAAAEFAVPAKRLLAIRR